MLPNNEVHALLKHRDACLEQIAALKTQVEAVNKSLLALAEPTLKEAMSLKEKDYGTFNIVVMGNDLKVNVPQSVKYDSAKMLAIAMGMTWEKANKTFKIECGMAEKVYGSLDALDPDLKKAVDAARTTKTGTPTITATGEDD